MSAFDLQAGDPDLARAALAAVSGVGTACVDVAGRRCFVKVLPVRHAARLTAEMEGLARLRSASVLRCPEPLALACNTEHGWLVSEGLDLRAADDVSDRRLGRDLGRLHHCIGDAFGLPQDNYIGATRQRNTPAADWATFWSECRIRPQIDLLKRSQHTTLAAALERVDMAVPRLLGDRQPTPSLLHGDLWCGNRGALPGSAPVVFDPAVYYGDRETDLAMARLFGGFSASFFDAYQQQWPLAAGWEHRLPLYQLYHVVNHALLFGGGYSRQALELMQRLTR